MRTGILLSIGCSSYLKLRNLASCEKDAKIIAESLSSSHKIYSGDGIYILNSPRSFDIRSFFADHAADLKNAEVFTVFFSGHGGVANGNFYLCPNDYDPNVPTLYGISISEIIRIAGDLKISVLNIVIDACESGHSGVDLREVIEKPAKENENSLCISLLASSLSDQPSIAGDESSAFTSRLRDLIIGDVDVQVSRGILSLNDLVHFFSEIPHSAGRKQNIVSYAVNVLGPCPFCENPLVEEKRPQPHSYLVSPRSALGRAAFHSKASLESSYASIGKGEFKHLPLVRELRKICDSSAGDLESLDTLLAHYFRWFDEPISASLDWSLSLRISTSIAASSILVGWKVDAFMEGRSRDIASALKGDLVTFEEAVDKQDADLLGVLSFSGLDNLYASPICISHIYGRIGLILIANQLNLFSDPSKVIRVVSGMLALLQDKCLDLHIILNEIQGPHLGVFFAACGLTLNFDMGEKAFGLYATDYFMYDGRILRENSTSGQVLELLRSRLADEGGVVSGLATPDTMLPIILLGSKFLHLEETIDPYLVQLNGKNVSIFASQFPASFGCEIIERGMNIVRTVGRDFYTVDQYGEELRRENIMGLDRVNFVSHQGLILSAIACFYSDRFPIFESL